MLRFLPLAIAVSLAGAAPVSALTVVKVDDRGPAPAVAAQVSDSATTPTLAAISLLPNDMPEQANWAFLFGGIALIVALRLSRGQAKVSN
jgi:hypothetical protein